MAEPKIRYDILANAQGAESVGRLAAELEKLDSAFDPAVSALAQALASELRELGAQQTAIQRFRDLKTETEGAATALQQAQGAAQKMGQELASTEKPTRAQAGQMEKLRDAVNSAKTELQNKTAALDAARGNLSQFGIATDAVARKEVELRTAVQGARQEVQLLGQQQQAVDRFKELGAATETARARLVAADNALEAFRAEMTGTEAPTRAQTQQLARLSEAARQAQIAFQQQSQTQAQAGAALRATGVATETLVASQARARTETLGTSTAAQRLSDAYRNQGAAATQSASQQVAASQRVASGVDAIGDRLDRLRNIGIAGILGSQTAQMLKSVGETADQFANLSARVRLVTGDGAAFNAALEGVFDVAKRTSSALESTATLFTRIAQAGKEIGVGHKEALALTESINQAIQLSGGSAESADAAVTQLIQGLQSGVLRGEEFNSVMEQAPRLAQALAAGLRVTTGELRNLAKEGQLTSTTVIQSLRDQSAVLKTEFGQLPATLGRAITNLGTEWTRFIGQLNSGTGATAAVAAGIDGLANNLDRVAGIAERAGAVVVAALAIKGAAALRTFAIEAAASAGAANLLATSISKIPTVVNITIAAIGFEVGFQIGDMLRENFALARQLGVGIVAFFENIVNDLKFVRDAAAAVFTDDTIEQAFERYRARGKELDDIFSAMWEDAAKAPSEIAAAANEAGQAAQQLGQAGQAAGTQISGAASGAAGSLGGIGKAAETAQGALQALASVAKINLPTVGLGAAEIARRLVEVGTQGQKVAATLGAELPAAIAKLAGPELANFRAGMVSALEASITASRRLAEGLEAAGKSSAAALTEVSTKTQLLNQVLAATGQRAAEALGVDVVGASKAVTAEFQRSTDSLSVLIQSLPALKAAGVDTASVVSQAIGKMIDSARNQAEIDVILLRLKTLGTEGVIGPEAVAGALEKAAEHAAELKVKLDAATPGVKGLGEAARKAGVDFEQLTTGVSKGFKDGAADIARLAAEVAKAGINAERATPLLAEAIDQRLKAARTKEELQLLAKVIQEMGTKGQLSGSQVSSALEEIRRKAALLSPALRQAQEDAERLGIKLRDHVGGGAAAGVEEAIRAYERLKGSGKASAGEIQAAFVSMANEVIQANGGIVPEWLKVEAAIRGATIAVRDFSGETVKGAREAASAIGDLTASFTKLDAVRSAGGKDNKLVGDGGKDLSVLGKNDMRAVDNTLAGSIADKLLSGTLGEDDRKAVETNFAVAKANLAMTSALTSSVDGLRDARNQYELARVALERINSPGIKGFTAKELEALRASDPGGFSGSAGYSPLGSYGRTQAPAPSGSTVPAQAPSQPFVPNDQYRVTVVIGGNSTSISAASKDDADRIIRALEDAYRAGGGIGP